MPATFSAPPTFIVRQLNSDGEHADEGRQLESHGGYDSMAGRTWQRML